MAGFAVFAGKWAMAEDFEVKAGGGDETGAEEVAVLPGDFTVTSKTFVPPKVQAPEKPWKFKKVDGEHHAKVKSPPPLTGFGVVDPWPSDTDTAVKIKWRSDKNPDIANADQWDFEASGELVKEQPAGGGGGGGGSVNAKWDVKTKVPPVVLGIIKPDGTEMVDDTKQTEGEVLPVNVDDVNNNATPDKDEGGFAPNPNCLIALKMHKLQSPDFSDYKYRLKFPAGKFKVWKEAKRQNLVQSEVTEFSVQSDTTVYVEGLEPSADMAGEEVALQTVKAGVVNGKDSVKLIVSKMMFAIFGDADAGGVDTEKYVTDYFDSVKKDGRKDPYIVKGASAYYGLFRFRTKTKASIALSFQDGYVAYHGHSNFGMGFAFNKNCKKMSDFMRVSRELVGIDWEYMVKHQGQVGLKIEFNEYGDDAATQEFSDPWVCKDSGLPVPWRNDGTDPRFQDNSVYFSTQPTAPRYTLVDHVHLQKDIAVPNAPSIKDFHEANAAMTIKRLVVKVGAPDMPTRRWKMILINSCYSGNYYLNPFSHGTVFYLIDEGFTKTKTVQVYFKSIINDLDDLAIKNDLNSKLSDEGAPNDRYNFLDF